MPDTPWVGLAALILMFLIPFLPSWLFEGPRTVKHWPRRHVCGDCGAPWTEGHVCAAEPVPQLPATVPETGELPAPADPPLRGDLRRLRPRRRELPRRRAELERRRAELEPRPPQRIA
jgi:hypothetical protein